MTHRGKMTESGSLGAYGKRAVAIVLMCCALVVGTGRSIAWADEQEVPTELEAVDQEPSTVDSTEEVILGAEGETAESEDTDLAAAASQAAEDPLVAAYVDALRAEVPADADASVLVAYAYRDVAVALALADYDTDAVSPAARELLANVASSEDVARAFAQFMQVCGIESKIARADGAKGAYHWVMVQLDGAWYHVDVARAAGELYVNVENRFEPLEVLPKWLLASDDALRATRRMRADDVWSAEDGGELPVATASYAWPEGQTPQDFLGAIEADLPVPEQVVAEAEAAAEEDVAEEPELTAQATVTSGECGTDCVWSLDSDGLLTIAPASGKTTGTLSLEQNVSANLAAAFKSVLSKGTTYNFGSISKASWTGEYDYFLVPNGGDGNPLLFVGKELESNTSVFSWRYLAFRYDESSNSAKQLNGTPFNVTVFSDDEKNLYADGNGLLYQAVENSNGSFTMRKCVVSGTSLQWSTYETLADEDELFESDYDPFGYSELVETDLIDEYIEEHGSTVTGIGQAPWYSKRGSIKKVLVKSGVVSGTSLRGLFKDCAILEEADLSGLDNSLATDCTDMFAVTNINGIKFVPLKKLILGTKYSTNVDGSVPDSVISRGRHKGQWYSANDKKWHSADYIEKNLSKRKNTYTAYVDMSKSDQVELRFGSRLGIDDDGTPTYSAPVEVKWDDSWLKQDSSVYNHDLGTVASILANNAYHDAGERAKKPADAYAYDSLLDLGFDMSTYYADYPQNDDENEDKGKDKDQVGYCFAVKWMGDDRTPLVAVLIRGTASEWEWVSNFNVAESDINRMDHEGFYRAFEKVKNELQTYLSTGKGSTVDLAKARFLVTGHSRGAAVANLMAHSLNMGEVHKGSASSSKERVYSYTFATPNPTLRVSSSSDSSLQNARENSNIYNILNPEDVVTKAALKQWGFSRYGVNRFLPNKNTDADAITKYPMLDEFSILSNGRQYMSFANGYFPAHDIRMALFDVAADINDYYNKLYIACNAFDTTDIDNYIVLGTIAKNYFYCAPASFMEIASRAKDNGRYRAPTIVMGLRYFPTLFLKIIAIETNIVLASPAGDYSYYAPDSFTLRSLTESIENNKRSDKLLKKDIENAFKGSIDSLVHMHTPETYVAWMLAGNENMYIDSSRIGKFACPVDIKVYDSKENLVCSIVDNEIDEQVMLNGLAAKVEGDVKYVSMPGNENYRIEATATDSGTMDISYADCTAEGDTISQATYTDLPLEEGKTYRVVVDEQGQTLSPVQEATVTNPSGRSISPTHVATDDEVSSLDIRVNVGEGNGYASGSAKATWGDPIVAVATPAEGAKFIGWYEDNVRISTDAQYQFRAEESRTIEARFSKSVAFSTVASIKNRTYTGKAQKPAITVKYDGKTLKNGTDYTLTYKNNVKVGTASVVITGKGSYTGTKTVTFKIVKANNGLKAKGSAKVVKYSKLAKKKQVVKKAVKVSGANGKVSYKLVKAKKTKKFAINKKTGAITVPKGTKKGTYKLKVKVTAAGDAGHNKVVKTVKVTIKVK